MNLLSALRTRKTDDGDTQSRYSFSDYLSDISLTYGFGGNSYTLPVQFTQTGKRQEPIINEYLSMVGAFKGNGVVFSVVQARARLFTEAEFKYKNLTDGHLHGDPSLRLLEVPWPNGTTGDMLMLAELGVSFGGNAYFTIDGDRVRWMRPDWVSIILASSYEPENPAFALDAEIVGYIYKPMGRAADTSQERILSVAEVAHWTPIPDPVAPWRGMSWLQPILREIMADSAATDHKLSFFENGATPNGVVKLPESVTTKAQFDEIRANFETSHAGAKNAAKTLYLAAGTEWQQAGLDMTKMDFRAIQGHGEVRIANAAGVPPSVVGLNESLQGAALNAGNFQSSQRLFADMWARPQWRSICAALAKLVEVPGGSRLWYDDRNIAFLRVDMKDEAQTQQAQSTTLMTLVNAGYEPDAAVEFIATNDPAKLSGRHTGLLSVQLQQPGAQDNANEPASTPDEGEVPDDERTEALQWSQAAANMSKAVGSVLSQKDSRTIMAYAGAPVDPNEELEPPEPAEPPNPPGEAEPEPMEPMDGPDSEQPTAA